MKKDSVFTKRIEIPHEKEIVRVIFVMFIYYFLLYVFDVTTKIPSLLWTNFANVGLEILITLPFFFVYLKWCPKEEKLDIKNKKQYRLVPVLIVVFLIQSILEGYYYYGEFKLEFQMIKEGQVGWIIFYFFYYVFIIGIFEEFICRILIQNDLVTILGKAAFLAPLISAAFFGYMHMVQRDAICARSAFLFGLIIGYAKYYFKNCTFITIVLAHGLFDFILSLL